MGNYENLKQSITEVIRTNGNQEITGDVLQSTLLTIISTVGANATFAGIATPTTNPGTPDGPVFWIASEAGTYTNFNAIELQNGLSVLMWNGSWNSLQIFGIDDVPTAGSDNLVKSGGVQKELALGAVYDVSAKNPTAGVNNDGKFESLSALLEDTNLNTLIPTSVRKGGMSIKFVQSSDNKYVRCDLKANYFTTDTTFWVNVSKEIGKLSDDKQPQEKGFFIIDAVRNIGCKYDENGFDAAKINEHFKTLLRIPPYYSTAENGFTLIDELENIIAKFKNNTISFPRIDIEKAVIEEAEINNIKLRNIATPDTYIRIYTTKFDSLGSEWVNMNNSWSVTNNGVTPLSTGANNLLRLNKKYFSDKRYCQFLCELGNDTVLRIPCIWNNTESGVSGSGEGSSCFVVDMDNKKLKICKAGDGTNTQISSYDYSSDQYNAISDISNLSASGKFIVTIYKNDTESKLVLTDYKTCNSCEVSYDGWGVGRQNQNYSLYCESGTLPIIYNFSVYTLNNPDVVFMGDSITEGVYVSDRSKRYAELYRAENPQKKVVISARGQASIYDILEVFNNEMLYCKPKILSCLIGQNGGNTQENLMELKSKCEAIGCTLLLHYNTCNGSGSGVKENNDTLIPNVGVNGARFDIATAIDNAPSSDYHNYNTALYGDDVHPNILGNAALYKRLGTDCKELYNI